MTRRSPLLASLLKRIGAPKRKSAPGPAEPGGKLFREEPADWKDAVYAPRGFRRKK